MDGEGFEPSKALLTDLQSAPFGHSGIHPNYLSIIINSKNLQMIIFYIISNLILKPTIGLEPITC
jgi:hypothetical protein